MDENDCGSMIYSPRGAYSSFDFPGPHFIPPTFESLRTPFFGDDDDFILVNSENMLDPGRKDLDTSSDTPSTGTVSKMSIAERRAATCGFDATRISKTRFNSRSPFSSPASRSPCLTIPPGISPTALLDSPVTLLDSQALGVPIHHQTVDQPPPSTDYEFTAPIIKDDGATDHVRVPLHCPIVSTGKMVNDDYITLQSCDNDVTSNQHIQQQGTIDGEGHGNSGDQREEFPAAGMVGSSEDGYHWRKYGQKQVKGSEYPRSYYKCTHPKCLVKKKVERSHEGQVTEIIYKASHNHQKPQPSRRMGIVSGSSCEEMAEMVVASGSCVKAEGWPVLNNIHSGWKEINGGSDQRGGGHGRASPSVITQLLDPLSTTNGNAVDAFESDGTPVLSSTLVHDNDEDGATQRSISANGDDDEDDSESKIRRKQDYLNDGNMPSRAIREPRVVLQIESDVDILDDGYRWRKYGQKVVKGNPNPRSYYKCTSAGCSVRKHVERASDNVKSVITAYEGMHNHEVPAARNCSSHAHSVAGNLTPAAPNAAFSRNANVPKPEASLQDLMPRFERKPEFSTEFLGNGFFGGFGNELKLGTPPFFPPTKLSTIQNPVAYGSFAPTARHANAMQSHFPDFFVPSANGALPGFDAGKPKDSVQSFTVEPQPMETNMRFIRPKQEQGDDSQCGGYLSIDDQVTPSSSSLASSLYCQIMRGYP